MSTSAPIPKGRQSWLPAGRRRSELLGFLLGVLGLLVLLSLISYRTLDPSFNSDSASTSHNWIGLWGSYSADAFFQVFGWAAFLLPVVLFVIGMSWLLDRKFEAPATKAIGAALLMGSFSALLQIIPETPRIRGILASGAITHASPSGSGLIGFILAVGLVRTFNPVGAAIVTGAVFLSSLFLVTRFSFSSAGAFLKARFSFIGVRWTSWHEKRERERLRRQVEIAKVSGKPPVVQNASSRASVPISKARPQPKELLPGAAPGSDKDDFEPVEPGPDPIPSPGDVDPEVVRHSKLSVVRGGKGQAAETPEPKITAGYKLPSVTLLRPPEGQQGIDESDLKDRARSLIEKFAEFGVEGSITQIHPGPVVTTFEFKPEAGIKYSRITSLVDDLCLAMKAESILIERIAGKSTVGIEVPNLRRDIIHLRELVESSEFSGSASKLTVCLGKDITGKIKVADLAGMPHLMIAGSTGSGKSVAMNSLIVSILYKSTPDEVKLILIDPKRLEMSLYDGVPHLFTPIVTEPKLAANVLRRATFEMEERLKKLAQQGVRNIDQYNRLFEPESTPNLFPSGGQQPEGPLPYIVIVIDELADLMMVEPQGVEESITRLAQMARAVGIHLMLATQRPSVDVITGLIKANMPSRVSFRVASKVDSRTILDSNGAEALLGRGDMLFMPPASSRLLRLHGALVTEAEINKVVAWWKAQSQPEYNEEFLKPVSKDSDDEVDQGDEESMELDEVYEEAVRLVVESGKASTSLLQRRLRLGYGRAARLLDLMQKDGIISAPDGARPREVLKKPDWLHEIDESIR